MCLNIDLSKHKLNAHNRPIPKVTAKDKIVYKVLRVDRISGGLESPYKNVPYKLGKKYRAAMDVVELDSNTFVVEAGLHAYAKKVAAIEMVCSNEYVFTARIPAGSKYFLSDDGKIVSNTLIVSEKQPRK